MKSRSRFVRLCVEELESRVLPSSVVSTNWSGYAVSSGLGSVTAVSGSWVVPAIQPGSPAGYSSAWVGIDGYKSSSVEQIGTDSDMVGGVPQYYAWWEVYPNPSITIVTLPIHAGDTISASVNYSGGIFQLAITDVTDSKSFSIAQSYLPAQRSSAEWIQEAPSSSLGILPLSDFGTINFSNAQATIGGITGPIDSVAWSNKVDAITMSTILGAQKATISGLTDSGLPATSSFSATWVSSGSILGKTIANSNFMESVTQASPTSSAVLHDIGPDSFQAPQPTPQTATYSAATYAPVSTGQAAPLNRDVLAPVSFSLSISAAVGGANRATFIPRELPGKSDPANAPVHKAVADKAPPAVVLPTPSIGGTEDVQTSEVEQLTLPSEQRNELNSQSEEESSTVAGTQDVILLLALLGGSYGFAARRSSERRRQPS